MLIAKKVQNESIASSELSLGRGLRTSLCDEVAFQHLDAYYARESAKQELADFTRIDDDELLGRLVDAGFTPRTLPAIRLVPIAFVAWASESVSEQECQAAVMAIYESHLHGQPAAAARVQGWLDVQPKQELWDLWVDFTKHQLSRSTTSFRQKMGRQLLSQATKVAIASGGLFGVGAICKAENRLLQAIRNVFFVRDQG